MLARDYGILSNADSIFVIVDREAVPATTVMRKNKAYLALSRKDTTNSRKGRPKLLEHLAMSWTY